MTCARCGKIQKESEFAASVDCGWLSWGVGLLLVQPLKWTFSSLLGGGRVPPEEPYVVIDLLKVGVVVLPLSRRPGCSHLQRVLSGEGGRGGGGAPPQPPGRLACPFLRRAARPVRRRVRGRGHAVPGAAAAAEKQAGPGQPAGR